MLKQATKYSILNTIIIGFIRIRIIGEGYRLITILLIGLICVNNVDMKVLLTRKRFKSTKYQSVRIFSI